MPQNQTNVHNPERFIDFNVLDRDNSNVGEVDAVWEDPSGEPAFLSVRTGWLGFGRAHVVPAEQVSVNERGHSIRLPYSKDVVKNAPSYDDQSEIDHRAVDEIYNYYRGYGLKESGLATEGDYQSDYNSDTQRSESPSGTTTTREDEQTIPLKEEQLHVGKREETSGVRLRKVVRTEVVNKPVEVEHEELVVDRENVDQPADQQVGAEEDVYISLRREEPVVDKDTRVREEVRVGKEKHTEHQDIRDEVRKEDVEIDRDETNRRDEPKP